eukprot:TRINITY_DN4496_c0_g1_i1.p1 TRINITY_DN4496_c0_g1~~TRINITY_DN4496_c0_g1_i1.p1  ORF type:complete len:911 (+),score=168.11 TRINITY_DN4496_c0_g1_i1:49-2781(+)
MRPSTASSRPTSSASSRPMSPLRGSSTPHSHASPQSQSAISLGISPHSNANPTIASHTNSQTNGNANVPFSTFGQGVSDTQRDVAYSADTSHVKVTIRLRPVSAGVNPISWTNKENPNILCLQNPDDRNKQLHEVAFDKILSADSSQNDLFTEVAQPLCDSVLDGFNACCFAYGQTGSGKTYSMVGDIGEKKGIIPRSMEYIFTAIRRRSGTTRKYSIFVSLLEIYLDQIGDLGKAFIEEVKRRGSTSRPSSGIRRSGKDLSAREQDEDGDQPSLEIRERPDGLIYVKDLTLHAVNTPEEVDAIIRAGFAKRATFETSLNPISSRSHTIFTVHIVRTDSTTNTDSTTGLLHLVDLAGSERLDKSHSEGQRLKEAVLINKSLSALGNVVIALNRGDAKHIPYRDSKLTRLLQNSLGGNSYTTVLGTLYPLSQNYEECLATLQFGNRCRNVQNQPHVNYLDMNSDGQEKRIKKLLAEVAALKAELTDCKRICAEKLTHDGHRAMDIKSSAVVAVDDSSEDDDFPHNRFQPQATQRPMSASDRGSVMKHRRDTNFESFGRRQVYDKSLVDSYRQKIAQLTQTIETFRQEQASRIEKQTKDHESSINKILENSRRLLGDQLQQGITLTNIQKQEKASRINDRLDAERQYLHNLRELEKAQLQSVAELKAKYEYLLQAQSDEMRHVSDSHRQDIEDKQQLVTALQTEIQYLYEYIRKVTTILENVELGVYPLRARVGMRAFAIPKGHRPGDIDFSVCHYTKRLIAQSEKIIAKQDDLMREELRSKIKQLDSDDPNIDVAPEEDLNYPLEKLNASALRVVCIRLRERLASGVHELPTQEVVNFGSLSASSIERRVVEKYESEIKRLQSMHREEVRKNAEMRIALASQERLLSRRADEKRSPPRPRTAGSRSASMNS